MTKKITLEAECFYRARDSRTREYLENDLPTFVPVSLHASADACESKSGQLILTTLVNQLARLHRKLHVAVATPNAELLVPSLCDATNLGDELFQLARRIDPYGTINLAAEAPKPNSISIGVGAYCRKDLAWYLGCDRSNAELARTPRTLGQHLSSDLRGAGLAALLGAAASAKEALNLKTVPTKLSAWNLKADVESDPGPDILPPIDVGRGLIVGAGAVASAVVYWLMHWGNLSSWTIVDGDEVKIHNTNRCPLFFPDDTDWFEELPKAKVNCLNRYLDRIIPIHAWYDQAKEVRQVYDTVLVLANERNVRSIVSTRNDPIQLEATTGRSWLSQLHRHIAGRDDCVRCRMSDIRTPQFACSEAPTATIEHPERPDAALPFLSAASGLMLVSALQRLQLGDFGSNLTNRWSWDFRNTLRMHSLAYCECRSDCSTVSPLGVRTKVAERTRWVSAPWLGSQ